MFDNIVINADNNLCTLDICFENQLEIEMN